ncbi:MAG: serine hydrolase, partial [Bacteroidia bacterium]|nr:serine hydrolase [Bacteroidia bacterium]
TKTYIAVLLLKMQEKGLLSLDDTIGKWIQGYPNLNTNSTIRQCLNHQAGNREYLSAQMNDSLLGNPSKIWSIPEILSMAGPANFSPGTSWNYSNTNYIITGYIIEKVLNKTIVQAMREWVLDPNGWDNTFFYGEPNNAVIPNQWTMNLNGTNLVEMNTYPINIIPQLFSAASSAGALMTTAEENVDFWYKLIKGNLLSPASLKELVQTIRLNTNSSYGLGIFRLNRLINGRTVYSHGGTFLGFINENAVDTLTGVSISVLTNQDSIDNNILLTRVIPALHKLVLNAYPTGIDKLSLHNKIQIYPNPSADFIHVKLEESYHPNSTYRIINSLGQTIKEGYISAEPISVNEIENGIYYLQILNSSSQEVITKTIWIKH